MIEPGLKAPMLRDGHALQAGLPGVAQRTLHLGLPQDASGEKVRDAVLAWMCQQARAHFIDAKYIGACQIQNAGNPCIPCRNTSRCTANSCRAVTQEVVIHDAQAVLRHSLLHQTQHQQEHPA